MPWFEIGPAVGPDWRGKPPQMLERETPVWWRYLDRHMGEYERIYYALALTLKEPPTGVPEAVARGWMHSVAKRIDAVGVRKDGGVDLVEVTTSAGLRAVGQAATYSELWRLLRPLPGRWRMLVVCEYADEDVRYMLEKLGAKLVLVP